MNPLKPWYLKTFFDFGVWGLETTFGPLGLKRRIKPLLLNRNTTFCIQHLIVSRIKSSFHWNYEILKKFVNLGSGVWKLHLGHLGPKDVSSHNSWTLSPIFTYKTSFYPESKVAFIEIMKSWKSLSIWGMGSGNYIWATWAQKTYQAITPAPYRQFSHTRLILSRIISCIQ